MVTTGGGLLTRNLAIAVLWLAWPGGDSVQPQGGDEFLWNPPG